MTDHSRDMARRSMRTAGNLHLQSQPPTGTTKQSPGKIGVKPWISDNRFLAGAFVPVFDGGPITHIRLPRRVPARLRGSWIAANSGSQVHG